MTPATRSPDTILLVENEPALRDLMRRFLEGAGYQVLAARNGDEALDIVAEHATPIDLLLTDIVMPGMSGFALGHRMEELRAESKVVYFSGYADDYAVIRDGLNEERRPFLLKPFTQSELLGKIVDVLGHPSPQPQGDTGQPNVAGPY